MKKQHGFGAALVIAAAVIAAGCGGTLNTGIAKKPIKNKPAEDGTCPTGRSVCGTGAFAVCVVLQSDPEHCGACDRACTAGIACEAGVCQQTVCTGGIPFSGQPTTSPPDWSVINTLRQLFADVNGDGQLDLVDWLAFVTDPSSNAFHVSLGQPDGGFAAPDAYDASFAIQNILVTDYNEDGFDDLFVVSSANPEHAPSHVEVWLGHADGHLTRSSSTDVSGGALAEGTNMAIGDISGDGWPDLVMPADANSSSLNVFLSDSAGALHLSRSYATRRITQFFIRDWNGDGSPDLAVLTGTGLEILHNRGDGTFEQAMDCGVTIGVTLTTPVLIEDFNRDGWMDLALGGNPINVILGLSECGFAPISYYQVPVPGGVPLLRAADMNGDGLLDIVAVVDIVHDDPAHPDTVINGDNLLTVLLGTPDGTFQLEDTMISLGTSTIIDITVGEGTGDHRPDVVVSSRDGQSNTWENTCQ